MWTKSLPLGAIGLIAALFAASPAFAQATRTWVSGMGDDANPCSRTAPCKTWAGAIAKTTAGGEIDALDPGGFGAVTITKAITLDGGGQVASVLVSGTNGIVVAAGASDVVILRNLRINGIKAGLNGVLYNSGAQLNVENCEIFGFTQSGISVSTSAVSELYVTNTFITSSQNGISLSSTATQIFGGMNLSYIVNPAINGVQVTGGTVNFTITNSLISSTNNAVLANSAGARVNIDTSSVTGNNVAFNAAVSGAIIRVSNNTLLANTSNFTIAAGATIASSGNNRVNPTTTPVPNATLAQQ
jgi:hypothetical protein